METWCFPLGTGASFQWQLRLHGRWTNLLFLNVHSFLNIFPFRIGGGSGELCLWTRTSAWQTLHHIKTFDALQTFVTSLQGQLKTPCASTSPYRPVCTQPGLAAHAGRSWSSGFVQSTSLPVINCFWEGEPFGRKCGASLGAKITVGQLFTVAVHRWGKVLFLFQVNHQPG